MSKTPSHTDAPESQSFIDRHADAIAYSIIGLTALMALLLFSVRMSEGGDDSAYICKAADFADNLKYPNFQGPLYPIFLSIFVTLAGGISLIPLKLTSFVLIIAAQLLTWLSLRKETSKALLLGVLTLMAVNMWFVQFGSLTYSEPLFLVITWGFAWSMLKLDSTIGEQEWRSAIIWGAVAGLIVILAYLTRTVGFGLGLSGLIFLVVRKGWRQMATFAAGMVVFFGLWSGIKSVAWPNLKPDNHQLETLLQVHPYDASQGRETIKGFFGRFVGNSDLYISKHYVKMFGLRDKDSRDTNRGVTVALYALFLWGAYASWKKRQRAVMLVAILTAVMLGMTFFSLQTLWDQYRLILPFVAMMHIVILYAIADLVRRVAGGKTRMVMGVILALTCGLSFVNEAKAVDMKTLRKNISGDPLYGFTPDWYHYLTLCREIGRQMPGDDTYVASRKPDMARIYSGGKRFYGIFTIPSEDPDTLVDNLRKNGVTHIMAGSLRRDPAQAGQGIINTIHRYVYFITQKYPNFVEEIGVIGDMKDEPAALYKIHYENAVPTKAAEQEQ